MHITAYCTRNVRLCCITEWNDNGRPSGHIQVAWSYCDNPAPVALHMMIDVHVYKQTRYTVTSEL